MPRSLRSASSRSLLPLVAASLLFAACSTLVSRRADAQTFRTVTSLQAADGSVTLLGVVGGRVLYALQARFPTRPPTVWATDGTTQDKIFSATSTRDIEYPETAFGTVGGAFVFASGSSLWATQGTSATTRQLAQVGTANDNDGSFVIVDSGRAYFTTDRSAAGKREVWSSDGTVAGTKLAQALAWDPPRYDPLSFTKAGMSVVASLNAGERSADNGLWAITPTGGTNLLPGPNIYVDRACGTYVYLRAVHDVPGTVGDGLGRTDGTTAGTIHLADRVTPSSRRMGQGVCLNGTYVVASDDRLYASTGTVAGTSILRAGSVAEPVDIGVVASGTIAYFVQSLPIATPGKALWRTDGTAAGTFEVYRLLDGANFNLAAIGPQVSAGGAAVPTGNGGLFAKISGAKSGYVVSDGTVAGTKEVLAPNLELGGPSYATDGKAYFWLYDATSGYEPWVTDATLAGTKRIADHRPGAAGSIGNNTGIYTQDARFLELDGELFTIANDGTQGPQIVALRIKPSNKAGGPDAGGGGGGGGGDSGGGGRDSGGGGRDSGGGGGDSGLGADGLTGPGGDASLPGDDASNLAASPSNDSGCACAVGDASSNLGLSAALGGIAFAALLGRRRRARRSTPLP